MDSEQMVLADELDDCAKLCAVYSPDQCATLIDGIGWIAMRHKLRRAAHLLRALEQREAATPPRDVPEGFVLVPREPNSAMVAAAHAVDTGHGSWPRNAYRAMLAAAPGGEGEGKS